MPMDDVGEFKVDMPMAFRTHMGVLVEQRMLGEGEEHRRIILHYLRTIGSATPIGDGHHLTGGPFVPFHLCVFIGSVHDYSNKR